MEWSWAGVESIAPELLYISQPVGAIDSDPGSLVQNHTIRKRPGHPSLDPAKMMGVLSFSFERRYLINPHIAKHLIILLMIITFSTLGSYPRRVILVSYSRLFAVISG